MQVPNVSWESEWIAALAAVTIAFAMPPSMARAADVPRVDVASMMKVVEYDLKNGRDARERLPPLEVVEERCPEGQALLPEISRAYELPRVLLFAVWWKEDRNKCEETTGTHVAADLARPRSECYKGRAKHGDAQDFCPRQWRALQAVCAQRRTDGSVVCDPSEVKVGSFFEMGRTQTLPTRIMRPEGEEHVRTATAQDYDKDGVVDPFSIADALATTAAMLVASAEQYQGRMRWLRAAMHYNGSFAYVFGTPTRWGVAHIWLWYARELRNRKKGSERS